MGPNQQLHGDVPMSNQVNKDVNKVDASGDLGMSIRKAEVLDYIQGGESVKAGLSSFSKSNPEFIVLSEPDDLYPR